MAEYIDKAAAIESLGERPLCWTGEDYELGQREQWDSDVRAVESVPAVDVVPVRHGKWERHFSRPNVYADLYWHCSACGGKKADSWADKYKFCPDCGADMRKDGDDGKAD